MALGFIAMVTFFAATALLFLTTQGYVLERRSVFRNLRSVRAIELSPGDVGRKALAQPIGTRLVSPGLYRLGTFARRYTPVGMIDRITKILAYAGSPAGWDAERVLAWKLVSAGGLGLFGLLFGLGKGGFRTVLFLLMFTALGFFLPELILRSKYRKREEKIRLALPDSLDLLSITVEAGLGFDAAVAKVARQAGGPLGEELNRVLQEMQIGASRADALRELGERTTAQELKSFVLAMVQADIFGISVGKVLRIQSHEMRVKRRQMAEERAQKIPVKIVFPLLLCIFPALFIVLLGPAAIRIYQTLLQKI
jgi:tight adherence protein C